MRALIILFALILIGVGIGYLVHQDPGYVLVAYNHTTIETSLWVAAVILLAAYFVVNLFFWLIRQISSIGWRFSEWSTHRRERKTQRLTNKGMYELAEGNWARAETDLINAVKYNHEPLVNYLGAAYAANIQQAFDRRDDYLRLADKACKDSKVPVALMQAMLQIQSEQWEQALATLKLVLDDNPSHERALDLLKQVYVAVGDWQQLNDILPKLYKLRIATDEQLDQLQRQVYEHLLYEHDCWEQIPRKWQHDINLLRLHTAKLISDEQDDSAVQLIESALKREWDDVLISNYGLAKSSDINKQLAHAEKWLSKHKNCFQLLLCLGRLSLNAQFYGKAKEYLEQALQMQQNKDVKHVLAKVFVALGDKESALTCLLD